MTSFKSNPAGTVLTLALLVLFSAQAYANEGHDKKGFSPENRLEKMKQQLSLTDEQAAKIKGIFDSKEFRDAMPTKEEIEKRKALKEKAHRDISAVLTDEQRSKFEELKKNRKERWQKKGECAVHGDKE